jgi:hypothetical protein
LSTTIKGLSIPYYRSLIFAMNCLLQLPAIPLQRFLASPASLFPCPSDLPIELGLRKAGAVVHLLSGLPFTSFFPLSRHSRFSRLHFSLLSITQLVPTQTGSPLTWFNKNSLVISSPEGVEFSCMAGKIIARTMAEFERGRGQGACKASKKAAMS